MTYWCLEYIIVYKYTYIYICIYNIIFIYIYVGVKQGRMTHNHYQPSKIIPFLSRIVRFLSRQSYYSLYSAINTLAGILSPKCHNFHILRACEHLKFNH
jgi:hypothetical protein